MSGNNPYRPTEADLRQSLTVMQRDLLQLQEEWQRVMGGHYREPLRNVSSVKSLSSVLDFVDSEERRDRRLNDQMLERGYEMALHAVKEKILSELARVA